ncbi:hypothetical protein IAT40_000340 [Kwoniella sp. CBS 6097]
MTTAHLNGTKTNGATSDDGQLLHFTPPYADLQQINISTWNDGPEAQQALADQLYKAMTTDGFFVLTGIDISEEEIARQVDIGYTVIEKTPIEEKLKLDGHMDPPVSTEDLSLDSTTKWKRE